MKADGVDAELRQALGDSIGLLVGGEAGAEAEVDAPESDPFFAAVEMLAANRDEAIVPRRCIQQRVGRHQAGHIGVVRNIPW